MSKTTKHRKTYRNGDPISLLCSCDGCSPSRINGVLCHEHGCPDAWRDEIRECGWCGAHFLPEDRHQAFCSEDCGRCYHGFGQYEDFDDRIEAEESDLQEVA